MVTELASARSPEEVRAVVMDQGLKALGATGGVLAVALEDGQLGVMSQQGYQEEMMQRYVRLPADSTLPLARAFRVGEPMFVSGVEACLAFYPPEARDDARATGMQALACIPLTVKAKHLGVLGLTFSTEQTFDPGDREHALSLGRQAGIALERAQFYSEAQRAAAHYKEVSELQEVLLGVVSHDLRSPLSAITLGVHLLGRTAVLGPKQTETLGRVASSATRMQLMISDLLDFSVAKAQGRVPVHPRPTDFHLVCRSVIEEVEAGHPDRTFEYDAEGDGSGQWDPSRLQQVVSNLLSNAVQYGDPAFPIRISWRGLREEVVLEVNNQGGAIDAAQLPRLFDAFRRGRRREPGDRNLGLGLFIVKHLVEAHGGCVSVHSNAAEGTTFQVRLPRQPLPGPNSMGATS